MRMIGRTFNPPCRRCCGDTTKAAKRRAKRRERQSWKREVSR
jgi:hypothetical protein